MFSSDRHNVNPSTLAHDQQFLKILVKSPHNFSRFWQKKIGMRWQKHNPVLSGGKKKKRKKRKLEKGFQGSNSNLIILL